MLLMLVLIVMIVSVALLLALLSGFFPFVESYGEVTKYTTAYYGAMSAIERGSLAVRYAGPGFDGESGWKPTLTGHRSDARFSGFYTYGNGNDMLFWKVRSSTDRIPAEGEGNVEAIFIDEGDVESKRSKNFNMLGYASTELLPLGVIGDIDSSKYYSISNSKNFSQPDFTQLKGEFRLNPFLFKKFGKDDLSSLGSSAELCESSCPGDLTWRAKNQVVATRTIKGKTNNELEFTMLPKDGTVIQGSNQGTISDRDTLIRKNRINQFQGRENFEMIFGNNSHPFKITTPQKSDFNIVFNASNQIFFDDKTTFKEILSSAKDAYLSFSLVNYLWSEGVNLYPFLEYAFVSEDGKIADRFYTIQGEGKVGDYHIKLQVKKPTLRQPALGNFTIIF